MNYVKKGMGFCHLPIRKKINNEITISIKDSIKNGYDNQIQFVRITPSLVIISNQALNSN